MATVNPTTPDTTDDAASTENAQDVLARSEMTLSDIPTAPDQMSDYMVAYMTWLA